MAAVNSFFNSMSETVGKQMEAGSLGAIFSTKDIIANDGLFGRKKTRLYFTQLQSIETSQDTTAMETKSEVYSLPDVELYIDPKAISVKKKVNQKRTLTKAGYVVQFWGHDLTTVSMSGISGYYGVTKGVAPRILAGIANGNMDQITGNADALKAFEYLKENAYMKRFDTRLPYKGIPVIGMVYDQIMYRGYFETFDYSLDAAVPFSINWSLSFTIIPPIGDLQQIKNIPGQIETAFTAAGSQDTLRGMASGTITNPNGTVQKVSDAVNGVIDKSSQAGVEYLSKNLGVSSFLSVTPSRVLLY